jgi:hypothetical protein
MLLIKQNDFTERRIPNMQLSGIMQARKKLLFTALFLAILVPLFFTLAIRSQLSLVSPSGDSPLIAYVHECMTSGFWMDMIGEGTFYGHLLSSPKYQIGVLLIFQSLVCVVITLLLLWLTLYCKRTYLTPFTVAYTILSALIFLATMGDTIISEGGGGQYCAPMLWGSYLREGRGLGSVLVYLAVVGCYFVSLARSRRENRKGYLPVQDTE